MEPKHAKKSTAHRESSSGRFFSVCGLFCGQREKPQIQSKEKVLKSKEKQALSAEKTGFCGAATQIWTGDLILTNGNYGVFFCFMA